MTLHTLRIAIPSLWIGLLIGLAFIETPLKFLAPGVTLEIALGIGRLVLTAADIAGAVLLLVITVLSLLRPRVARVAGWLVGGLWTVLLVQLAVIRPILNARTDVILAGGDPGGSSLHTFYVIADVLLIGLLVAYIVVVARAPRVQVAQETPIRPQAGS